MTVTYGGTVKRLWPGRHIIYIYFKCTYWWIWKNASLYWQHEGQPLRRWLVENLVKFFFQNPTKFGRRFYIVHLHLDRKSRATFILVRLTPHLVWVLIQRVAGNASTCLVSIYSKTLVADSLHLDICFRAWSSWSSANCVNLFFLLVCIFSRKVWK